MTWANKQLLKDFFLNDKLNNHDSNHWFAALRKFQGVDKIIKTPSLKYLYVFNKFYAKYVEELTR